MSIIEKAVEKLDKDSSKGFERIAHDKEGPDYEKLATNKELSQHNGGMPSENNIRQAKRSRIIEIDLEMLKKSGYLTPGTVKIALAEQYRRIKRPILINAFENKGANLVNPNLVMVTSAIPKEGKSYTSLNLALSIATEINQTVLFIDSDVTRHTVSTFLGLGDEPGLTDLLMGESMDLSDYMLKTNIDNLSILPAGKFHEKTHEMWASKKMRNLMTEISSRYNDRIVIIDSSPLLLDSSSQILSRIVGQVLFVIEAEKTHQQQVTEALETIAESQYIGIVVNKSNRRDVSDYGYYGQENSPSPPTNQA